MIFNVNISDSPTFSHLNLHECFVATVRDKKGASETHTFIKLPSIQGGNYNAINISDPSFPFVFFSGHEKVSRVSRMKIDAQIS